MLDPITRQVLDIAENTPLTGLAGESLVGLNACKYLPDAQRLTVVLGLPCQRAREDIAGELKVALSQAGIALDVDLSQNICAAQITNTQTRFSGIKNIIAVASGKGGVGKSTTAANLALALSYEGASVGLLDADIYGPSQSHMLGIAGKRPAMHAENMMAAIPAYGIKAMSMGNLVTENTPMVWRGPMVSGALQQLLKNTYWGDLDYLIVDMPPGTGDIALTLSQSVPVAGSVIVTTPQDIALIDAKKGIEMFEKVNISVLGIVENMALHICTNCGHHDAIFGSKGAETLAEAYHVDVLARLPLRMDICQQSDAGKPPVATDPESEVSRIYRQAATRLGLSLWRQSVGEYAAPQILVSDD